MTTPVVTARGVGKRVRDGQARVAILSALDLTLAPGERVALVGPSGSGKSTLLHILGALDPQFDGEVELSGTKLRGLSEGARARLRNQTIGFVFQAYNLLPHLTVLANVLLPSRFGGPRPDLARAREVLGHVGMGDKLGRRPTTLSGGERQRVAIARALYHRPKLVLADEPTGNLDQATGAEILALFNRLQQDGIALLCATHDPAIAASAERVLTLAQGRLVS
jgi:putative ABC transport system ATP-binding protein